ncbi:MAG: MFS transporter [Bauldia sp.]|nr:MAG: MFS transporter [Bauldia sp.]
MNGTKAPLSRTAVLGLVAMGLAVLVIANDFTALSVALPAIEVDFAADVTTVQWVINGYALVFGVLIVTGGRLADIFGHRRIFFIGSAVFALFSAVGGVAEDVWTLLACRGVMGIGGAMMWPAILGMTYGLLPESRKGLAGGLILGAAGFGNAVGPLLGGALTDWLSWRRIFFLNFPIAAFAVLVTWRVVAADEPDAPDQRIDYAGVGALSVGLLALLLALDEGTDLGWSDPWIVGLFALCALGLTAFFLIERGAGAKALVPGDVLRNREFFAACLATLMMSAIFFAALLYLPQFMVKALGYSAVGSGAGLLPMMGVFALTSFVAGSLYERLGPKLIVSLGAACLTIGIFLLSLLDRATPYDALVPGMVVLGVGVGLFYSSITTTAVTALDPSRSSLAGGIIYMFQIAGGSIGLGLNTALVVSASSLSEGIRVAFLVDAVLALCGLAVSILFVGGKVDRERLRGLIHHHRAHG